MFRLLLPVELLLLLGHSFAEGCRLYKCQLSWFAIGIDWRRSFYFMPAAASLYTMSHAASHYSEQMRLSTQRVRPLHLVK